MAGVLNKNGVTLLTYRQTYRQVNPNTANGADIRKKLSAEIYKMYCAKRIPESVFKQIFDQNVPDNDFIQLLEKYPEFKKSSAEMSNNLDVVRREVNKYLTRIKMTDNISTKNLVAQGKVAVIHTYDVSRALLIEYFGLSQEEMNILMRRKGFADKFCALRLNRIFTVIYSTLTVPNVIGHRFSVVYYNNQTKSFSIDYEYILDGNFIRSNNNMSFALDRIKLLDTEVTKKFQEMMCPTYFEDTKMLPSQTLDSEIVGIEVAIRTGKKSQEIKTINFFTDTDEASAAAAAAAAETAKSAEPTQPAVVVIEPTPVPEEKPASSSSGLMFADLDDDAPPAPPPPKPDIITKTGRQVADEAAGKANTPKSSAPAHPRNGDAKNSGKRTGTSESNQS